MNINKDLETSTPIGRNNSIVRQFVKVPDTPRPSEIDLNGNNIEDVYDQISSNDIQVPRMSLSPQPIFTKNRHSKVSFLLSKDLAHSTPLKTYPNSFSTPPIENWPQKISPIKSTELNKKRSTRISMIKCRICLEYERNDEPLLSPCLCKGTVGLMHCSCLDQWIQSSGKEQCEICKYKYDMRKKSPNFQMWLSHISKQRSFMGDIACFLFLVPCTTVAMYFCIQASLFLFSPEAIPVESHPQWRGMGLIILSILLIICLFVWMVFTAKYYLQQFYHFKNETFRYSIHNRRRSTLVPTTSNI